MRQLKRVIVVVFCLSVILPCAGYAQYKDFVRKETKTKLFAVDFDKKNISISKYDGENAVAIVALRENINLSEPTIRISNDVSFAPDGLMFQGTRVPYERISGAEISRENDLTKIMFFESAPSSTPMKKTREGNVVTFSDPISINRGDFVRGMVFSIKGPITVGGEVNKDIISLFGDITLITDAVARGDIVSISGTVTVEKQASVYGEIYSGIKDYDSHRFRFYRGDEFESGIMMDYNRVDGLLAGGTGSYSDADSIWPSIKVGLGYAMESERVRYFARATQLISRQHSLFIEAEYYKRLASEDDWLLSDAENAVFVLLATEDFKDYYETEGLVGRLAMRPKKYLTLNAGFRYDDTRRLQAKTHLWSIFGGSKLFRQNFSSVETSYRSLGNSEIDATSTGSIFLNANFETKDFNQEFNSTGWGLSGELEWSHPNLGSDFQYRRYSLTANRYQYLNKFCGLKLRGKFADSDGYLPMYKRFFIGGLGTLPGYRHKEFMGSRYWMANSEFWLNLPIKFNPILILFGDAGQIANDAGLGDNAEIRNDLGVGLQVTGIRLNVAKRLDGTGDRDPQFYVRLARGF